MRMRLNSGKIPTLNIEEFIISLSSFLFIFLNLFNTNHEINSLGFLTIVLIVFLSNITKEKVKTILSYTTVKLWLIFSLIFLLNQSLYGNYIDSLSIVLIPLTIMLLDIPLKKIVDYLFIGLIPTFFGIWIGILLNHNFSSNSIGLYLAAFSTLSVCKILFNGRSNKKNLIYVIFNISTIYPLYVIYSRTSILIVILSYLIAIGYLVFHEYKNKFKFKSIANKFMSTNIKHRFVLILALIIFVSVLFVILAYIFLNYFNAKWDTSDISTGRFFIWKTTIKHSSILGHKVNWYTDSGLFKWYKGPHNLLISILAFGGYSSLIPFVLFLIMYLIKLFKNLTKDFQISYILILILFSTAILKGTTETLLFPYPFDIWNILFYISFASMIGLRSQNRGKKLTKQDQNKKRFTWYLILLILIVMIYVGMFGANIDNIIDFVRRYV